MSQCGTASPKKDRDVALPLTKKKENNALKSVTFTFLSNSAQNMHLTKEQQVAVDTFCFISPLEMKVVGSAGTGKTTVCVELLKHAIYFLQRNNNKRSSYIDESLLETFKGPYILPCNAIKGARFYPLLFIAPTHKAKMVCYNMVQKHCDSMLYNEHVAIVFTTMAQMLKKKKLYTSQGEPMFSTGNTTAKTQRTIVDRLRRSHVMFVDEISMIGTLDVTAFQKLLKHNTRVVYVGDGYQLPPVNEYSSHLIDLPLPQVTLTEIIRTKDDNIKNVYLFFRQLCDHQPIPAQEMRRRIGESLILQQYRCDDSKTFKTYLHDYFDPSLDKIITYSNQSVADYNNFIRGDEYLGKLIKPNERFVMLEDYSDLTTCTEFTVIGPIQLLYIESAYFDGARFFCYKFMTSTAQWLTHVTEQDMKACETMVTAKRLALKKSILEKKLTHEETTQLWTDFYNEQYLFFPPLAYAYASTVYKAQGSTYRTAFIDLDNILLCCRANITAARCMYTAMSRASECIVFKMMYLNK